VPHDFANAPQALVALVEVRDARRPVTAAFAAAWFRGLALLLPLFSVGCALTGQPRAPSTVAAPVASSRDPFREPGLGFERIALRRFRLSLEVPDPKGWRPERGPSRFVRLEHPATASSLAVRAWLEVERMTPKSCEEAARLFRELPKGGELLAREPRVVAGFESEVRVGLRPASAATPTSVEGYVTAFGARGRACLAFSFVTRGDGVDARRAVEERLALFDERTLAALRPEGFDEDALRESSTR
jgi:hypothetical protein